jgi:hypothetical protein
MVGPHALRCLWAELSDARVAISEASAHPERWGAEGNTAAGHARRALGLLAVLADALAEDQGGGEAIDAAWLEVNRLWKTWHQWVPAPGLDGAVWRAVDRVRAACWHGRMTGTIWEGMEGSKAKWPNYREEARRLGQVCRSI